MNRDLHDIQAILERTPRVLNALLHDLPESWTLANEGGDSWTPVAIVAHYIDTEYHNWITRAQLIMESPAPPTFPKMARTGHNDETEGKTLPQLLDLFADLRRQNLSALHALHLKPADLERTGIHPAFGPVTLGNLLATWAAHDLTHLHQLSRTLAHQLREDVGPWTAYLGVMKCTGHSS